MPDVYTPRLSVEISEETYLRMQNRIPWGLKSKIMVILLEDLLDLIEKHGNIVLAAIIDRTISSQQVIKGLDRTIRKEEESGVK
uniref:Uncharacterized protein n=1 Tax=viral metagenome TaxID=1070528 RepID=A0A6M3JD02_9ZZZZ